MRDPQAPQPEPADTPWGLLAATYETLTADDDLPGVVIDQLAIEIQRLCESVEAGVFEPIALTPDQGEQRREFARSARKTTSEYRNHLTSRMYQKTGRRGREQFVGQRVVVVLAGRHPNQSWSGKLWVTDTELVEVSAHLPEPVKV